MRYSDFIIYYRGPIPEDGIGKLETKSHEYLRLAF